jgi:hypothetical protein
MKKTDTATLEPTPAAAPADVPAPAAEPAEPAATPAAPRVRRIQKRFVIMATPRSGSSHLVDLLDSHPQMSCIGELFNPHFVVLRKLGLRNKKEMARATNDPLDFIERVVEKLDEQDECKPYFGFKLMLHHDPRVVEHIINNTDYSVIVLERRDRVAQWTSAGLAKKTGKWGGVGQVKKEGKDDEDAEELDVMDEDGDEDAGDGPEVVASEAGSTESPKVKFDPKKFEAYCKRMKGRYSDIYRRLENRRYYRLFSEDIDASHANLLKFLGVDPVEMQSTRPRQNSTSMKDRIRNYNLFVRYAQEHGLPIS